MSQDSNPSPSSKAGWKAVVLAIFIGLVFLGFFYMAVTNEPDYMPSQKHKQSHSAHQATAPVASEPTATEMNMTEEEHAHMADHEASAAHAH
ncbi:hypothetical protein [Acinetobacter bouvetii]|uniref:DUF4199 domain-containing protein n=1 Tax=Acinetobacter bouvetii TaxID=202951 RepID=A0A811G8A9_9GAMM|nr:hypothetical protein [Acinetobacter bouvetii]CAB1209922.1 hypothetical protein SFB21_0672 [Acinetobacter bouvetii]